MILKRFLSLKSVLFFYFKNITRVSYHYDLRSLDIYVSRREKRRRIWNCTIDDSALFWIVLFRLPFPSFFSILLLGRIRSKNNRKQFVDAILHIIMIHARIRIPSSIFLVLFSSSSLRQL